MNDMAKVIIPKSDQWNFDDFQAGPLTFTIESVRVRPGTEQPVEITMAGTPKFYRPCKSMARVIVNAWGADSSKYAGRSLTLYGDPTVKWGGLEVGGIRISHMSDIDAKLTMALTMTKQNRKPFTVRPLEASGAPKAAATQMPVSASLGTVAETDSRKVEPATSAGFNSAPAAAPITPDEALALEARCKENDIPTGKVKATFAVGLLSMLTRPQLVEAHVMIDSTLAARKAKET